MTEYLSDFIALHHLHLATALLACGLPNALFCCCIWVKEHVGQLSLTQYLHVKIRDPYIRYLIIKLVTSLIQAADGWVFNVCMFWTDFWLAYVIFVYRPAHDSGSVCSSYLCRTYSRAKNLLHMNERLSDKLLHKVVKWICITLNWLFLSSTLG